MRPFKSDFQTLCSSIVEDDKRSSTLNSYYFRAAVKFSLDFFMKTTVIKKVVKVQTKEDMSLQLTYSPRSSVHNSTFHFLIQKTPAMASISDDCRIPLQCLKVSNKVSFDNKYFKTVLVIYNLFQDMFVKQHLVVKPI